MSPASAERRAGERRLAGARWSWAGVVPLGAALAAGCGTYGGGGAEGAGTDTAAVAGMGEEAALLRCEPPGGQLAPGARAEELAGGYRLILETREGPRAGTRAEGELRLVPWQGEAGAVSPPPALSGTASLDPAAVGAPDTGDPSSEDPAAPGVLVFEIPAGGEESPSITLRLGHKVNRLDRLLFDAAWFVLRVRGIGPGGFHGAWDAGPEPAAGGHFCAVRL